MRWKALIKGINIMDAFFINSANILFNNILPSRTGELSWFYYANKLNVSFGLSLWSFLVGRLFDLMAMFFLFLLLLFWVHSSPYAIAMASLLLACMLSFKHLYILIPPYKRLKDLRSFIERQVSFSLSLKLSLLSSLSVLSKFMGVYVLVGGDLFRLFLGFLGGELSSILPLHSFMGYGTYELSFALALRAWGTTVKESLPDAFLVHNFLLLSSFMLGIPSLLFLHARRT